VKLVGVKIVPPLNYHKKPGWNSVKNAKLKQDISVYEKKMKNHFCFGIVDGFVKESYNDFAIIGIFA